MRANCVCTNDNSVALRKSPSIDCNWHKFPYFRVVSYHWSKVFFNTSRWNVKWYMWQRLLSVKWEFHLFEVIIKHTAFCGRWFCYNSTCLEGRRDLQCRHIYFGVCWLHNISWKVGWNGSGHRNFLLKCHHVEKKKEGGKNHKRTMWAAMNIPYPLFPVLVWNHQWDFLGLGTPWSHGPNLFTTRWKYILIMGDISLFHLISCCPYLKRYKQTGLAHKLLSSALLRSDLIVLCAMLKLGLLGSSLLTLDFLRALAQAQACHILVYTCIT